MGREHFLAGIGGYRPDLSYSTMDDRCIAQFPGYDKPIAMLPSNTVDAVFTSKGMLAYRDSRGEMRALQIADHEPIYAAAVAAVHKESEQPRSIVTGKPMKTFSQIMGRHTGGIVSADMNGHGLYRYEAKKDSMEDAVNRIVIGKDACLKDGNGVDMMTKDTVIHATISASHIPVGKISTGKIVGGNESVESVSAMKSKVNSKESFEHFAAEMVKDYIAPLVCEVQRLAKLNTELTNKVKALESRPIAPASAQPVSSSPSQDIPIREVSWGDQGGLPNFIHPQDNPFCGKRRG